jgi:hypothetical protein
MGLIVVERMNDRKLYAFSKDGTQRWVSNTEYQPAQGKFNHTGISFADFNGDGYTEVYAGHKIFDLESGRLLLDMNLSLGEMPQSPSYTAALTDVDGDGKPEILCENKIFKVTLSSRTGTAGNSFSVLKELPVPPHTYSHADAPYGIYTLAADFDLDGSVDVLVFGGNWFYIWDSRTGVLKCDVTRGGDPHAGHPSLGDVDGDGYPEMVFAVRNKVVAWNVFSNGSPAEKWAVPTADASGFIGVSIFDFNGDGAGEIVIRDESALKVIDGRSASVLASRPCYSLTVHEYPVIADVDGDGMAEIIVTELAIGADAFRDFGFLRVYNPIAGTQWMTARKVWNEYFYTYAAVNSDMSMANPMLNIAGAFAGADGVAGNADDRRPYNNTKQQVTNLTSAGLPTMGNCPDPPVPPQPSANCNAFALNVGAASEALVADAAGRTANFGGRAL